MPGVVACRLNRQLGAVAGQALAQALSRTNEACIRREALRIQFDVGRRTWSASHREAPKGQAAISQVDVQMVGIGGAGE